VGRGSLGGFWVVCGRLGGLWAFSSWVVCGRSGGLWALKCGLWALKWGLMWTWQTFKGITVGGQIEVCGRFVEFVGGLWGLKERLVGVRENVISKVGGLMLKLGGLC